jgi:hypothetical protein
MTKFTYKALESFEGYTVDYVTGIYVTVFGKGILLLYAYSHRVSKENYQQILKHGRYGAYCV